MHIDKVRIKNFRSIKDIEFQPTDITALVGPNNSGKTNILAALNFVLGDRFPVRQGLSLSDYFNQSFHELAIEIYFADNPHNLRSVWVAQNSNQGDFKARFRLKGDIGNERYLSNEVRDQCSLVYVDASRNFDSHFSTSRWSVFGRIAKELHDDFFKSRPESEHEELRSHLESAQELLRTDKYQSFEDAICEAFLNQIRHTKSEVKLEFRSFDPLNFYKSLQPLLVEDGLSKNPAEAGSGMRNLIVLALFRAYAKAFRGNAIFAIEEPELYLHPHAQRSLAILFSELATAGNQIFFSTHSPAFVDVSRSDRIVRVMRCEDYEQDLCTKIETTTADEILVERKALHPGISITIESMRERYRNLCGLEQAEGFFAEGVLIVEGPSEREAIPIYARACGVDFDALGISVISAGGKTNIDSLYHLYAAHEIPVYVAFDNDRGGREEDIAPNKTLTRLLGIQETDMPDRAISEKYAVFDENFEEEIRIGANEYSDGLFEELRRSAVEALGGKSKPLIARYIARELTKIELIPGCMRELAEAVRKCVEQWNVYHEEQEA